MWTKVGTILVGVAGVLALVVGVLQLAQSLGASSSQDQAQATLVVILERQLAVQSEIATLQASKSNIGSVATVDNQRARDLESTIVALVTLQSNLEATLQPQPPPSLMPTRTARPTVTLPHPTHSQTPLPEIKKSTALGQSQAIGVEVIRDNGLVIKLNDGSYIRITSEPSDRAASLSRDGSKLLFARGSTLFVVNLQYPAPDLVAVQDNVNAGEWSPDGNQIAFTRYDPPGWSVWVMNEDGSQPRQLNPTDINSNGSVYWTTDGHIIFKRFDPTVSQYWIVNSDGTNLRVAAEPITVLLSAGRTTTINP